MQLRKHIQGGDEKKALLNRVVREAFSDKVILDLNGDLEFMRAES